MHLPPEFRSPTVHAPPSLGTVLAPEGTAICTPCLSPAGGQAGERLAAGCGCAFCEGGGWLARSVTQPVGGGGVQVATTPVSLELVSSSDVSWNVLQAYKRIKVYLFFLSHPRTQVPQLEERTCSVTGPSEVAGREC